MSGGEIPPGRLAIFPVRLAVVATTEAEGGPDENSSIPGMDAEGPNAGVLQTFRMGLRPCAARQSARRLNVERDWSIINRVRVPHMENPG